MESAKNNIWGINSLSQKLVLMCFVIAYLLLTGVLSPVIAQEKGYTRSSWWFGAAGGVNYNLYHGSSQEFNPDYSIPVSFDNKVGKGLFAFPVMEYHRPGAKLGFMLFTGYEGRRGNFNHELSAKIAYLTFEPSIRLNLFNSPLYLYSGPRLAYNVDKRFLIGQGVYVFDHMKQTVISMQIGAGYDFVLTPEKKRNQTIISPFITFHPYFGQNPRSIESWNMTTIRVGIAFKFARGQKVYSHEHEVIPVVIAMNPALSATGTVSSVNLMQDTIRETLPLQENVYFDLRPHQPVISNGGEKKVELELSVPENPMGSPQQNVAYQNILNVLGNRLVKDPAATITLIESSAKYPAEVPQMAESIKAYLVGVFGIEPSRISARNLKKSELHKNQTGSRSQIATLLEGNRQVSIESKSSSLMMKFINETNETVRSAKIFAVQEAPEDSYVTFNTRGENEAFSFWSMEVKDPYGKMQSFGPYNTEIISLPEKSLIGTGPEGNYDITLIGQTKDGRTVRRDTSALLKLWTPPTPEKIKRFSIIYEFSNPNAINLYKKYLDDVVVPQIPQDATVIIHGHTDMVGGDDYDLRLYLNQTNDARKIIERALSSAGRNDVKFEVHGFGEDQLVSFYENSDPRYYNRTVIIDVVPAKK